MKKLFTLIPSLCIFFLLLYNCKPQKAIDLNKNDFNELPDTSFFGEYCYMLSLESDGRYLSRKNVFVPRVFKFCMMGSFRLKHMKYADREKVIRLIRLANIDTRVNDAIVAGLTSNKKGIVDVLYIHPRAIYGRVPVSYITAFDSLKYLEAPFCPVDVREVIKKLTQLEELNVRLLTNEPCTLDLSGLDMRHIKKLVVDGPRCEQIIFPEKNDLKELRLLECNIKRFDSSFQNLKSLKRLIVYNLPLQKIDVHGMDKLDSIWLHPGKESPSRKKLLANLSAHIAVQSKIRPWHTVYHGSIERDSAATNEPYKLHAAAMKCDCK